MAIIVNTEAANRIINEAAEKAVKDITSQANKGQSNFRIQYWAPSYDAGSEILRIIELEGVKCSECGFGSHSQNDGSYRFDVRLQVA